MTYKNTAQTIYAKPYQQPIDVHLHHCSMIGSQFFYIKTFKFITKKNSNQCYKFILRCKKYIYNFIIILRIFS